MGEESHLDEMRDAIRGDFERLAARRGEQELMRVNGPEPSTGPDDPLQPEAEVEERLAEPEHEPTVERRSWLERLFST